MENNEIKYGIVYNPVTNELFYAQKNCGAFKNDKKIFVSKEKNLKNSLLVTGFPYYTHKNPRQVFDIFNKFSVSAQGIRRLGSAALDMCYVAEGVFEGFWEENLQPWDVAAGELIVKESGGKVSDYFGKNNYLFGKQLVVSNGFIHNQMLNVIKKFVK
jgi:myo-inositol-1(or 4)-monophosphatase